MPDGSNPTIGPDATGVGSVFQYALVDETGNRNLAQLRGVQDWFLRYALASVDGVAEVASIGGFVKQYQVNLDPNKLVAYDKSMKIADFRASLLVVLRCEWDPDAPLFETRSCAVPTPSHPKVSELVIALDARP